MIKIRLARHGAKKAPFYRIVAIEKSRKRNGMPLDILGFWKPSKSELKVDKDKLSQWVKNGAQVSDVVKELIETNGKPKKKKVKKKAKETEKEVETTDKKEEAKEEKTQEK